MHKLSENYKLFIFSNDKIIELLLFGHRSTGIGIYLTNNIKLKIYFPECESLILYKHIHVYGFISFYP